MESTIINRSNWITVARNSEYLSGKSSDPFKVEIIANGEYLPPLSSHTFETIEEAEERAMELQNHYQINWGWEEGLQPEGLDKDGWPF